MHRVVAERIRFFTKISDIALLHVFGMFENKAQKPDIFTYNRLCKTECASI